MRSDTCQKIPIFFAAIFLLVTQPGYAAKKAPVKQGFVIRMLTNDEKNALIENKRWEQGCPVSLDRLRIIEFRYHKLGSTEQDKGSIIVMDAAAKHMLQITKALYRQKFPIEKADGISGYSDDQDISLFDNNTISFNCRKIYNTDNYSIHSYGLAIDVNPTQNPSMMLQPLQGKFAMVAVFPPEGQNYLNRTNLRTGMIESADKKIVDLFANHGFTVWGGKWNTPVDWMHFQTPSSIAKLLTIMPLSVAEDFFELYTKEKMTLFAKLDRDSVGKFLDLYNKYPDQFVKQLKAQPDIMRGEDTEIAYQQLLLAINGQRNAS